MIYLQNQLPASSFWVGFESLIPTSDQPMTLSATIHIRFLKVTFLYFLVLSLILGRAVP